MHLCRTFMISVAVHFMSSYAQTTVQDCEFTWGFWSNCSVTCGNGTRFRQAQITQVASPTGKKCPGIEMGSCEMWSDQCDPIFNCLFEWSAWSKCTVSCVKGYRIHTGYRTRKPVVTALGTVSDHIPNEELEMCNLEPCEAKENDAWNATETGCDLTASGCSLTEGMNCSQECYDKYLQILWYCRAVGDAETDCMYRWGPWSACSASCGGGTRSRKNQLTRLGLLYGKEYPSEEVEPCGTVSCQAGDQYLSELASCRQTKPEADCLFTWGEWSACSAKCDGGTRSRQAIVNPTEMAKALFPASWYPKEQVGRCNTVVPCDVGLEMGFIPNAWWRNCNQDELDSKVCYDHDHQWHCWLWCYKDRYQNAIMECLATGAQPVADPEGDKETYYKQPKIFEYYYDRPEYFQDNYDYLMYLFDEYFENGQFIGY